MRLQTYVERYCDSNFSRFAASIGWSRQVVRRWVLPFRHPDYVAPSPRAVVKIYRITGGLVTPNDLYALPRIKVRRPPRRGGALQMSP